MLYCIDLTVPANTSRDNPVTKDVTIKSGVIRKIIVLIPPGHFALAHMIIKRGGTQIIPESGDIHGDDETFTFDAWVEVPEPKCKLTLVGWNEDELYDHTFYVRINVLQMWLAAPERWLLEKIKELARRIRISV